MRYIGGRHACMHQHAFLHACMHQKLYRYVDMAARGIARLLVLPDTRETEHARLRNIFALHVCYTAHAWTQACELKYKCQQTVQTMTLACRSVTRILLIGVPVLMAARRLCMLVCIETVCDNAALCVPLPIVCPM